MIRVKRVNKQDLCPQTHSFCKSSKAIHEYLINSLGFSVASCLCFAIEDGDYFNVYSATDGKVDLKTIDEYSKAIADELSAKAQFDLFIHNKQIILNFLKTQDIDNAQLIEQKDNLIFILEHAKNIAILDKSRICLLPLITQQEAIALKPVTSVNETKTSNVNKLFILLPLLLLLLLIATYFIFLYPWPFDDKKIEQNNITNPQLVDTNKKDLTIKVEGAINVKVDKQENQQENYADKILLLDNLLKQIDQKLLQIQKIKSENRKQTEQNLELQKQEEKKVIVQEDIKKDISQNSKTKKLKKCHLLKEQDIPTLIIALDVSRSMIEDYYGLTRIDAAKKASLAIIDNIDKNVEIGLVDFGSCPSATPRGVFDFSLRSRLKSIIKNLSFYGNGGTPLIETLYIFSDIALSTKGQVAGVLLSDGEDTCPHTAHLDICTEVKKIHKLTPNLKIDVIALGDWQHSNIKCVADITGGKVYLPQDAKQLQNVFKLSTTNLQEVCIE